MTARLLIMGLLFTAAGGCSDNASRPQDGQEPGSDSGLTDAVPFDAMPPATDARTTGDSSSGGDGPLCNEASQLIADAVADAIELTDRTCSTDDDCVGVSAATACSHSCRAYLSAAGAELLRFFIEDVNSTYCADFEEAGCTAFVGSCPVSGRPVCANGGCIEGLPGPAECPRDETGLCPNGCAAVVGALIGSDPDGDAGCESTGRRFGCVHANPPPPATTGCIRERSTGNVYRLDNPYEAWFADDSDFEPCSEDERELAVSTHVRC